MALSQTDFKLLENVDSITKYLVHGFIRNVSKNMPLEIVEMCILFYFICEYLTAYGQGLSIEGDKKDIIKSVQESWRNMAYGSIWFDSRCASVIKWTLEMTYNPWKNAYAVGIMSKEITTHRIWYQIDSPNYFLCNGAIYDDGKVIKRDYLTREEFGETRTSITMELDLKKGQLSFYNDDKHFGVATMVTQKESVRYKLAITLYYDNSWMKLIKFECN